MIFGAAPPGLCGCDDFDAYSQPAKREKETEKERKRAERAERKRERQRERETDRQTEKKIPKFELCTETSCASTSQTFVRYDVASCMAMQLSWKGHRAHSVSCVNQRTCQ